MNRLSYHERLVHCEDPVKIFGLVILKENFIKDVNEAIEKLTPEIGMVEFNLLASKSVFLLHFENEDLIIAEKEGEIVGTGSFFSAKKVNTFCLSTFRHKFIISKLTANGNFLNASLERHQPLIEDVLNQNIIAKRIHQNGKVTGVVKPYLITKAESNLLGVFSKYYYGSLTDCCVPYDIENPVHKIKFKLSSILLGFRQVLEGLKKMHAMGIYPGDIKPGNILYKGTKFVTIDFGDAIVKERLEAALNSSKTFDEKLMEIAGTATPLYTNYYDILAGRQAVMKEDVDGLIEVFEKTDVFSLGKTLYETVTQKEAAWGKEEKYSFIPVKSFKDCRGYYNEIESHLRSFSCPKELIDLIILMVEPDYRLRPTASSALESLDEVIRKKIKRELKSLYKEVQKIESLKTCLI